MPEFDKNKYRSSNEWKEIRKKVLHRDNYTCQMCGIRKLKGQNIHHLDPSEYGSENINNLITLCPTCHTKILEWMLRRTKNKIDINRFCKQLKKYYTQTMENL